MAVRQGTETLATPEALEALVQRHAGRTGGIEAESSLMWEASDPHHVLLTTSRGAQVTAVVRRCGSAITRFWDCRHCVTLEVKTHHEGRKVFRGLEYAFAPIDFEKKPFPRGKRVASIEELEAILSGKGGEEDEEEQPHERDSERSLS